MSISFDNSKGALQTSQEIAGILNVSANLSVACISELIRRTRPFDDVSGCIQSLWHIWQIRGISVTLWPIKIKFPWEDVSNPAASEVDSGSGDATPTPATAVSLHVTEPVLDHNHHRHRDDLYTIYPADAFFFFFFIGFILLICGAVLSTAPSPYAPTASCDESF